MRRQPAHFCPLVLGELFGMGADQPHEENDKRPGNQHDQRADPVGIESEYDHCGWQNADMYQRRNVSGEIVVEPVDPIGNRCDQGSGPACSGECGTEHQNMTEQFPSDGRPDYY